MAEIWQKYSKNKVKIQPIYIKNMVEIQEKSDKNTAKIQPIYG